MHTQPFIKQLFRTIYDTRITSEINQILIFILIFSIQTWFWNVFRVSNKYPDLDSETQ